jgi:hypothetical protein
MDDDDNNKELNLMMVLVDNSTDLNSMDKMNNTLMIDE